MRKLCAMLLFCTLVLVPIRAEARVPQWWPCEERSTGCPTYEHRIPVIDRVRAGEAWRKHRDLAIRRWNRCDSVHLFIAHRKPYSPNTITLQVDWDFKWDAYGGWVGDHGVASFSKPWTMLTDVITHEVGHALGFGHTRNNWSIMGNGSTVAPIDCRGLRYYYGG